MEFLGNQIDNWRSKNQDSVNLCPTLKTQGSKYFKVSGKFKNMNLSQTRIIYLKYNNNRCMIIFEADLGYEFFKG